MQCPMLGRSQLHLSGAQSACVDQRKCGNGVLTSDETCDDGNTLGSPDGTVDGCSADCHTIDPGWQCRVPGKPCTPICGDGKLEGGENCDDGNTASNDGCSTTCQREPGADCPTPGSLAKWRNVETESKRRASSATVATIRPSCQPAVGARTACSMEIPTIRLLEDMHQGTELSDSSGNTQACATACGDGNIDPNEACDDGNQLDGDGCSSKCTTETGFVCTPTTHVDSSPCSTDQTSQCLELPVHLPRFPARERRQWWPPRLLLPGHKGGWLHRAHDHLCPQLRRAGQGQRFDCALLGHCLREAVVRQTSIQFESRQQPVCLPVQRLEHRQFGRTHSQHLHPGWQRQSTFRRGCWLPWRHCRHSHQLHQPIRPSHRHIEGIHSEHPRWPHFHGVVPIVKNAASFKQWFTDDATVNKTFPRFSR